MLYTSNELQKKLDKLTDERNKIQSLLSKNSEFTASISENVEILKLENAFDLESTLNEIESYNSKIMKIKHAKNVFNSTFKLPCGYTIDEAIIRMGILSGLINKLNDLSMKKAKERKTNGMMRGCMKRGAEVRRRARKRRIRVFVTNRTHVSLLERGSQNGMIDGVVHVDSEVAMIEQNVRHVIH